MKGNGSTGELKQNNPVVDDASYIVNNFLAKFVNRYDKSILLNGIH